MIDWPYPRIIAHRGGGSLAPENTLAAIRVGQSLGFRMHEFDVKLSRDGVAYLMHDATLERTTSGQGEASGWDWARLSALDAGAWHSERFRGEPLASFESAARLLRSKGTMANVEIKPCPGFERETGRRVAELCREHWDGAEAHPLLSSFSFEALEAARDAASELPRAWLERQVTEATAGRIADLGAVSFHTNHKRVSRDQVERLRGNGTRVLLYTVDDEALAAELLGWGIDGLFTDNLQAFAQRFPGLI